MRRAAALWVFVVAGCSAVGRVAFEIADDTDDRDSGAPARAAIDDEYDEDADPLVTRKDAAVTPRKDASVPRDAGVILDEAAVEASVDAAIDATKPEAGRDAAADTGTRDASVEWCVDYVVPPTGLEGTIVAHYFLVGSGESPGGWVYKTDSFKCDRLVGDDQKCLVDIKRRGADLVGGEYRLFTFNGACHMDVGKCLPCMNGQTQW